MKPLFPLFLKLEGRRVLVVGGGAMAAQRVRQLAGAGAAIAVVAPEVRAEIAPLAGEVALRPFRGADVDGAWIVIAAATPEVNRAVTAAAEARGVFVNAVDDPATATAYCGGIVRRAGALVAISTEGRAPALAALLREGIESLLPADLDRWMARAEELRGEWKKARIAMAERRPKLLEALNALYASVEPPPSPPFDSGRCAAYAQGERMAGSTATPPVRPERSEAESKGEGTHPGFVSLVGAGPGDPDLLTVKAVRRLGEADLVLYDALVNGEVLRLAPRAHCFFVGKRAGRPSIAQETIQRMLVDAARLGKRVVRLKCGDPFVLGRGGEEALALEAAGVAYEVVPGLSSALTAPALAGIPVTHRGLASAFTVVSGHAPESFEPVLRSLEPGAATVVVLMGLAHRGEIAATLVERGWAAATPAAIAFAAGTPDAFTWVGTLGELPAAPVDGAARAPGTIVVGDVVSLARAAQHEPQHDPAHDHARAATR
ncbi:MAG: uroporphyrinogen-III C-methyltransferase [Anaeromyxobacteraceae bacterium]